MNVAINLLNFLVSGSGGVETYINELISRIGSKKEYKNIKLYIFMRPGAKFFFKLTKNIKVIRIKKLNKLNRFFDKVLKKMTNIKSYETRKINEIINKYAIDIIHYPFGVITNFEINKPTILSVMDIQEEFYPEFFSKEDLISRKKSTRPSCERADKIIAISDFTKNSLIDKYKIVPNKISTVHLGSEVTREIKEVPGLPSEFIYYPAGMWQHKNHKNLFSALQLLKEKYKIDVKLVLTGVKIKNEKGIKEAIKKQDLLENVIILGYISTSEISYLYSKARLLVFPSLFEGFGMPPLEAMGMGLPVACSNVTSLPEIVGDAALMFDPEKPEEIATAVYTLWNDAELRKKLKEKGLRQSKNFSWDKTVLDTVALYKRVLKK